MQKVVLLDRDGTIIRDPEDERVTSEDKIRLFDDSVSALQKLAEAGFAAIIITNQAGMGEGRLDDAAFHRIHAEVLKQLAPSGIKFLKTYYCPHTKEDGCECRKPKPTMVADALRDFHLDAANLFMVGDHNSDVQAGKAAGTKGILVQTAVHGQDESPEAELTAQNLTEAVDYIINNS